MKSAVKEMSVPSGLCSSRLTQSASLSACRLSSVTWPSGSRTRTFSSDSPEDPPTGACSPGISSRRSSSGEGCGTLRPRERIPGGGRSGVRCSPTWSGGPPPHPRRTGGGRRSCQTSAEVGPKFGAGVGRGELDPEGSLPLSSGTRWAHGLSLGRLPAQRSRAA